MKTLSDGVVESPRDKVLNFFLTVTKEFVARFLYLMSRICAIGFKFRFQLMSKVLAIQDEIFDQKFGQ